MSVDERNEDDSAGARFEVDAASAEPGFEVQPGPLIAIVRNPTMDIGRDVMQTGGLSRERESRRGAGQRGKQSGSHE
jgi:hypothetical protein